MMVATAACAPSAGDEEAGSESASEAVVDGDTTWERPEIGAVFRGGGLCTGTLIRPDVVLTAMHCTGIADDKDVTNEQPAFAFEVRKSATEKHRYAVDRIHSIAKLSDMDGSQRWRAKDIALLHLTTPVPGSVARPADMARTWPWIGKRVAVFGYGCTDRAPGDNGRRPGSGTKRKREYGWTIGLAFGFQETQDVCPGDSGGPLLDLERNAVVGINSGYVNGDDRFGDVPANYDTINVIVRRWTAR